LIFEPLKAVKNLEPLKRLPQQFLLFQLSIFSFLVSYVGFDHFRVSAYRRYIIASGPEIFSSKVPLPITKVPRYVNRALSFDETLILALPRISAGWIYTCGHDPPPHDPPIFGIPFVGPVHEKFLLNNFGYCQT
jgi:hypothetical protein